MFVSDYSVTTLQTPAQPQLGGSFLFSAGSHYIVCVPFLFPEAAQTPTQSLCTPGIFQHLNQTETCVLHALTLAVKCLAQLRHCSDKLNKAGFGYGACFHPASWGGATISST